MSSDTEFPPIRLFSKEWFILILIISIVGGYLRTLYRKVDDMDGRLMDIESLNDIETGLDNIYKRRYAVDRYSD